MDLFDLTHFQFSQYQMREVLWHKRKLQVLCIEFFFENNLIKYHEKLLNIYISLILFLTKYGSKNILDTITKGDRLLYVGVSVVLISILTNFIIVSS